MNQFGEFTASELFCPKCQRSQPVREKLLLVLPSGEINEFLCSVCGASLGQRTITGGPVQPVAAMPRRAAKSPLLLR